MTMVTGIAARGIVMATAMMSVENAGVEKKTATDMARGESDAGIQTLKMTKRDIAEGRRRRRTAVQGMCRPSIQF